MKHTTDNEEVADDPDAQSQSQLASVQHEILGQERSCDKETNDDSERAQQSDVNKQTDAGNN